MATFDQYSDKYQSIRMERRNGILQMTFHTNGDSLQWGGVPHQELPEAFADIGSDSNNLVVIMTGAGDAFTGPPGTPESTPRRSPREWDKTYWEGKHLLSNLLDIEVPMISAINGPAVRHYVAQQGQFINGLIPGDGMHVIYPLLLGLNRGRYFLLTGQTIGARQALELGLVNEVLPRQELLPRAWELAEQLTKQSPLVLRYSRVLLTQYVKRQMQDLLGYGLALEGLGSADSMLDRG